MKYLNIIVLFLFLTSCSAEWHLKRAIKKNPSYGDSTKTTTLVIVHDTIRDTLFVPDHKFEFTVDSLHNLMDSFNMVYNDSFVYIYGKLDSLGKLTFKGKVKERRIPYEVIVHDTVLVESKCPPNVTVINGYPKWYLWVLISIFATVILIKVFK